MLPHYVGLQIVDLIDAFLATDIADDAQITDHFYGSRMSDADRTAKATAWLSSYDDKGTGYFKHTPYGFEYLWNAMSDLQPLYAGMPKVHVINAANSIADSFADGHQLLTNDEAGRSLWIRHDADHYEPFVARDPTEFLLPADLDYFVAPTPVVPTPVVPTHHEYINIARRMSSSGGPLALGEYVGVRIGEKVNRVCNRDLSLCEF
jgi:hypothetical protein